MLSSAVFSPGSGAAPTTKPTRNTMPAILRDVTSHDLLGFDNPDRKPDADTFLTATQELIIRSGASGRDRSLWLIAARIVHDKSDAGWSATGSVDRQSTIDPGASNPVARLHGLAAGARHRPRSPSSSSSSIWCAEAVRPRTSFSSSQVDARAEQAPGVHQDAKAHHRQRLRWGAPPA